jgi:hypothetical protein
MPRPSTARRPSRSWWRAPRCQSCATRPCSKNDGLARALEKKLDIEVKKLPQDPQLVGALGAAIFAAEKLEAGDEE